MFAQGLSRSFMLLQLLGALVTGKAISHTPLYKDASAPVEKRIKDLLNRMTTEEKMAQLIQGMF
jgi:beta-glucosidase